MLFCLPVISMDKNYEHALYYDFYGALLTERQRRIYEEVKFGDLSLSEASEQFGISRQGVHDFIKRVEKTLEAYEEKLGLVRQFRQIKEKAGQIRQMGRSLQEKGFSPEELSHILRLTKEIEEL